MITKKEFLEKCNQASPTSTQHMIDMGFEPMPCDCGDEGCYGWVWGGEGGLFLRAFSSEEMAMRAYREYVEYMIEKLEKQIEVKKQ